MNVTAPKAMVACALILIAIDAAADAALPVAGQVVDRQARPVKGAEVAVYQQFWIGGHDWDTKLIAPIVTTDSSGRFQLQADVSRQWDTFIVARKEGLALAWDGLNYGRNTKGKGHFLLVLEPACVLAGQVVNSDGQPVARAQVQAVPMSSYLDRLRQRPIMAPREWFTTTTDAEGQFRFEQFAADVSASFHVSAPGLGSIHEVRWGQPNACGFDVWRSDIRLSLAKEGTVHGRVVDEQEQPVSGVGLRISPRLPEGVLTGLYLARETVSDRTGAFAFEGIPEGSSEIEVLAPEQGPDLWVGQSIEVSIRAGETATEAIVRVAKGGSLEVTALSAGTKRPIPGARVSLHGPTWKRSKPALTDANGIARLRAPAGEFTVYVGADQFSTYQSTEQVVAGQTLRYDALLSISPRVYGRVLDGGGEPVRDAVVSIHPFGDHIYTDSKGRFNAACDERRAANGGFAVAREVRTGSALALPVADWSRPIDLTLTPAWTLVGKVVDPEGADIPAARVSLCLATQNCLSQLGVELLTDAHGRFEMKAIPPVREDFTYRLSVAAAGYGPREYLRISPSGAPGTRVDIGETELPLADQSVCGIVVDANGAPAARVPIFVNGLPRVSQPSKATATNERGEFTLRRLCRGPIRLQANFGSSPGGAGYVKAELPAQDLRIVLGQQLVHEPDINLAGKLLPDLGQLGLAAADVDDKAVLVCFFDFQQRPSRNTVMQLARRADALAEKNIVVVAVQALKVEPEALREWIDQANLSLPIGAITGDAETTRLKWGVKSLPWLVLTDREHTIKTEGFNLDEIQQQIDAIAG